MKRLATIGLFLVAMVVGTAIGAGGWSPAGSAAPPAEEPSTRVETADAPTGPAAAAERWRGRPLDLPDFLEDDEPFQTQVRQLQIYARQRSFGELWSAHMAPVMAASSDTAAIDGSDGLSQEELEVFRGQLIDFSTDLRLLIDALPPELSLDSAERVHQAEDAFAVMEAEDLVVLYEALEDYPGFWETPSYALSLLAEPGQVPFVGGPIPGPGDPMEPQGRPTIPAVDPNTLQYDNCAAWGVANTCSECPVIDEVAALSAAFALKIAALGVELTCEFLPDKIFIGAATVINFTTLICNGIKAGLEIAAAGLEYAVERHDECEEDYHFKLVHLYLDESVMTRASEQSLDFHGLQELRLDIENNLLRELDQRVSLFQMPESQGGYLDAGGTISVRFVVSDTIVTLSDLGYDVRNAEDEFAAAEARLEAGDYKSAYARYRIAYREAVRVGRELPPVPYPPNP